MAVVLDHLAPEDALALLSRHPVASLLNSAFQTGLMEALMKSAPLDSGRFAAERGLREKTVELELRCLQQLQIVAEDDGAFCLTPEWADTLAENYDVFAIETGYCMQWDAMHRIVSGEAETRSFEDHLFGDGEGLADYLERVRYANVKHAEGLRDCLEELVVSRKISRLLDVGGGHGLYSEMMLMRHPSMQATICDLPRTLKISRSMNQESPVADRLGFVAGDGRALPELDFTPDLIFVNDLLHSFDFDDKRKVARCAVDKLAPGGLLVVSKVAFSPTRKDPSSAFFSMRMNLHSEGRGYLETDEECEKVFGQEPLRLLARHELTGAAAAKLSFVYERI